MTILRPVDNFEEPAPPPADYNAPRNGNGTTRTNTGRVPPHDLDAETSLLGAMLLSPAAIDAAANLTAADFYKPAHGHIFDACVAIHGKDEPVDPVTVADELHRDGLLERVGGPSVLVALQVGTPATSNAGAYARIVKDHADMRAVISAAADIADIGYSLPDKVDDAIAVVTAVIDRVVTRRAAASGAFEWEDVRGTLDGGALIGNPPTVLARSDGTCALFYKGRINNVFGESESIKSWIAQAAVVEQLGLGDHVFYFDFEKDIASVLERLSLMGASDDDLAERFHYQRREDPFTPMDFVLLRAEAAALEPSLVVFDGVTDAMRLHGLKILDNTDIAAFYAGAPHLFETTGAAVIAVDHIPKQRADRMPGSIGGQHKRAGITGSSLKMTITDHPARGRNGRGYLKIDKDAPGHLRGEAHDGESIGDVVFTANADGSVRVEVVPPPFKPITKTANDVPRRTGYMEKCSKIAFAAGFGGVSVDSARTELRCRREYVLDAFVCLRDEGYVTEEGEGSKRRFFHVRAFRDTETPTGRDYYEQEND